LERLGVLEIEVKASQTLVAVDLDAVEVTIELFVFMAEQSIHRW
jgi:hypothetical protein